MVQAPLRLLLPVRSRRVELRVPRLEDVEAWFRIINAPVVASMTIRRYEPGRRPWSRPALRTRIRKAGRDASRGCAYELSVVLRSSAQVIGRVALKDVDPRNHRAEVGYWFDPGVWGQGLASEAVHLLLREGFRGLELHRVDAIVLDGNLRSAKLLERLGFRPEGTLRDGRWFDGKWTDELHFGLLRGELRPPRRRLSDR